MAVLPGLIIAASSPASIAILARLSICDVENERSEMNKDIVKPIPPSIALPRM